MSDERPLLMPKDPIPPRVEVPPRKLPADVLQVRVVDVDISFGQMVILLVKMAIAFIPAAIILTIIVTIAIVVLGALFGGLAGLGSLGR